MSRRTRLADRDDADAIGRLLSPLTGIRRAHAGAVGAGGTDAATTGRR